MSEAINFFVPSSAFAMSKPAGNCVFCGGRPLTKSHIFPDWIDKLIGSSAKGHIQEDGLFETFSTKFPKNDYELIDKQGSAGQRKRRNTCLSCNGGWMSGIEDCAKRPGARLINGERQLLSPVDQMAISSLLCLISTRFEFIGKQRAVSALERDILRLTHIPSASWRIWIARFTGNPYEHWSRKYALRLHPTPDDMIDAEDCNLYVSTYIIGQLCAHVVYCPIDGLFGGYQGVHLTSIWRPCNFYIDTLLLPRFDDIKTVTHLHETIAREFESRSTRGT